MLENRSRIVTGVFGISALTAGHLTSTTAYDIEPARIPETAVVYEMPPTPGFGSMAIRGLRVELQAPQKPLEIVIGEQLQIEAQAVAEAELAAFYRAEQEKQQAIDTLARYGITGNPAVWLVEAGIDDPISAYRLIFRESTWQPGAINNIGCIGLGQNCPDNSGRYWLKESCPDWSGDPVCQLQRFDRYVKERYGSWSKALAFWNANGHY